MDWIAAVWHGQAYVLHLELNFTMINNVDGRHDNSSMLILPVDKGFILEAVSMSLGDVRCSGVGVLGLLLLRLLDGLIGGAFGPPIDAAAFLSAWNLFFCMESDPVVLPAVVVVVLVDRTLLDAMDISVFGELVETPIAPDVRGEGSDKFEVGLFGLVGFGDCVVIGTDADRCVV